ncbi:MAG: AI-2E family transporter [Candidatus Peribacteraceae bacterium]
MAVRSAPAPVAPRGTFLASPSPAGMAEAFLAFLAVAFGLLLAWLLRDIFILFLLGAFVATIIDPGVRALERWHVPRSLAVLLHFALFLTLIVGLLLSLVPILAEQVTQLSQLASGEVGQFLLHPTISLPFLDAGLNDQLSSALQSVFRHQSIQELPDALQRIGEQLQAVAGSSLQMATDVAESILTFVAGLVITLLFAFFLQVEREKILPWIRSVLSARSGLYLEGKALIIRARLAQWAKGQLTLCLVIAIFVYVVLLLLGMPYALTLAILAGFTEFIPYAGPFIAAVPAVIIALAERGFMGALIIAACYYGVQWTENNFIVPLIMKRAVSLSPVAIIFAMLVGVSFPDVINPVLGILLSIPATSIISTFLDDLRFSR